MCDENRCSAFVMGLSCCGYPDSELCKHCPCMQAGARRTPAGMIRIRNATDNQKFYQEQNKKASERQVGGTHYTDMGIQPFEFTYTNYGYAGLKAAVHTKVNKYLGRKKDDEVEQLKKARHCLDILIEKAELEKANG